MKLSKALKVIIGIGTGVTTIWPLILPLVWLFAIFTIPFADFESSQFLPLPFVVFLVAMPLMMVASFIQIALQVFYWSHIILNRGASDAGKILFGIGCFMLPWLTMPIYYFIHVLPDKAQSVSLPAL